MKAVCLLLLALCVGGGAALAQNTKGEQSDARPLGANSEGTRFVVGFMQNDADASECYLDYGQRTISIASRFSTKYSIILPDGVEVIKDSLKPFQLRTYDIDRDFECVGEGVFSKGIEIISSEPISVYCYSSRLHTSDGYLALPVTSWGTEYLTANYYLDYYTPLPNTSFRDTLCKLLPRGGEFAIIASEDNTNVSVYPRTRTVTSRGAPVITRRLMKGDIFQVQDGGSIRGGSDITGSQISSDKPVGVISGHMRAGVSYHYDSGKDHLIEMIPPRNTLGKRHMVVPFGGRLGGDLVRVISSDPAPTIVTVVTGGQLFNYAIPNLGGFIELDIDELAVITTDKPVLVTQYSKSAQADPRNYRSLVVRFDPDMVVVTPEEQFVNGAIFQTLPNYDPIQRYDQYDRHYLTIVGEKEGFSTINLNGRPIASYTEYVSGDIPNTSYRWASMRIADGSVHVLAGDALFGGYVYGLGEFDSYAWPVGAGLRKIGVPDANPPSMRDSADCGGVNIMSREFGAFESGLKDVWLDSAASDNVDFTRVMLIIGDEYSLGRVTLKDPRKSGFGRVIAQDLANNFDTIDIPIDINDPLIFESDSLVLRDVEVGTTYRDSFTIRNPNSEPMKVDDLICQIRKEFLLARSYNGLVIAPGDSLTIEVLFKTTARREQRDTLVLKVACQIYRIPMVAQIGMPRIATHDLDFEKLRVGRSRTLDLKVWNTGNAPLRLDSAVLQGDAFSITRGFDQELLLPPGGDTTLLVTFTPPRVGPFTGTVSFYSNADSVAIARLIGVGIYPRITIGGHDFDSVQVGDTLCTLLPVANIGDDTAHITAIDLADMTGFMVDGSTLPRDLAPGDTLWVNVCFAPNAERTFSSDVFPENSDGLETTNTIRGIGYMLFASIGGYDWKARWVNSKNDTIVFIRNLSSAPITIDRIWISDGDIGDFKVDDLPAPVTIPGKDSIPVPVQFSPLLPGLRSCYIKAGTSSRQTPVIDSILQGFGLMPLALDTIHFDGSTAYSCGSRSGTLVIYNDGNTPLELTSMQLQSLPAGVVTMTAPGVGQEIPVGDSVVVKFNVDFAGYVGEASGTISWSFKDMSETFSRTFTITSEPQEYAIEASTPPSVSIGGEFNLVVEVDNAHWPGIGEPSVKLRIENNPTVARFDAVEWAARANTVTTGWKPYGTPVVEPGVVILEFRPAGGDSLPLDGVTFLSIPYRGFLGNSALDTFRVAMIPADPQCAPLALSSIPYRVDSICNLSGRLLQFTGGPYALKQSVPNPSGATAMIEFTLGMEAPTTLELFSSDGRLIRMLVDASLPAGNHTVQVDVQELSSGLYYYRLTSGPYGAVRSMTVAK